MGEHTVEFRLLAEVGFTMIDAIEEHAQKAGFEDKELPISLEALGKIAYF